jgi:hypothetical protein
MVALLGLSLLCAFHQGSRFPTSPDNRKLAAILRDFGVAAKDLAQISRPWDAYDTNVECSVDVSGAFTGV